MYDREIITKIHHCLKCDKRMGNNESTIALHESKYCIKNKPTKTKKDNAPKSKKKTTD